MNNRKYNAEVERRVLEILQQGPRRLGNILTGFDYPTTRKAIQRLWRRGKVTCRQYPKWEIEK